MHSSKGLSAPAWDDAVFLAGVIRDEKTDGPLTVYHGGMVMRDGDWYGAHRQATAEMLERTMPEIAELERRHILQSPFFFTDSQSIAAGYADQGDGYEVREAIVSMKSPVDLRMAALRQAANSEDTAGATPTNLRLARLFMGDSWSPGVYGDEFRELSASMGQDWPSARQEIERLGFDGVIFEDTCVRGRSKHTTYAVFDPNQIRPPGAPCLQVGAGSAPREGMCKFIDCVGTPASAVSLLEDMIDRGQEIGFEDFSRRVGEVELNRVASELGYHSADGRDDWLTLKADYHVRFYESEFAGKPGVFMVHSAIEHVFLDPADFEAAQETIDALKPRFKPRGPGM